MSRQPPTQELVAKDLHASEWRFRHIFRGIEICIISTLFILCAMDADVVIPGQPRRHLLQSGWSVFVSSKRLVAGDAFIFLRFASFFFWFMIFLSCVYLFILSYSSVGARMENYVWV